MALHSPTNLIYGQLFTSYIQPPTSALSLAPLSLLPWREATRTYLVLNHLLLLGAIMVTLHAARPALPLRWVPAVIGVTLLLFSQLYDSFALGQVDATITLLLALGFWGYANDKPALTGGAIALAAAIKLIPGVLLLYFLWKREYRVVAWGAAVGAVLLALSLAYVGPGVYKSYVVDTLPALAKGSTEYANISFGAIIARLNTPDVIRGQPAVIYLDEVTLSTAARLESMAIAAVTIVFLAFVTGRGNRGASGPERLRRRFFEYYLVLAGAFLINSVTWEFYVIWLLPAFVAVFLAPARLLPAAPARWLLLGVFAVVLLALNLPGDRYLFEPNSVFYHPEWVPGVWTEKLIGLYHNHLDAVILLRLPALLLFTGTLAALVAWQRLPRRQAALEMAGATPPLAATEAVAGLPSSTAE